MRGSALDRIKMQVFCLDRGIVPLDGILHHDFREILERMSPDEARATKRKFRKLWRKIAEKREKRKTERGAARAMGYHKPAPTKSEKNSRKWQVYCFARESIREGKI